MTTDDYHLSGTCKKASWNLYALGKETTASMNLLKRKILINACFWTRNSVIAHLYGFVIVASLTKKTTATTKKKTMNRLHENNLLRIIYDDKQSSFDELLEKDSSVSVHERNIQILATEMYKVRKGISTPLIKLFEQRNEHTYNLRHSTEFLQPFVNFVHCGNERIL